MSLEQDLHAAAHHVHRGSVGAAVALLVKAVAALACEVAELKRLRCVHQSEPEHDVN